jgi:hypothetical protein
MIRHFLREKFYSVARKELAMFLEDHEEELLQKFREAMERVDRQIPEEESFIDIRMVPLGETIMRASLTAVREFLTGGLSPEPHETSQQRSPTQSRSPDL